MKVHIDQIPETGLELKETCQASVLDLDRADIKFTEPINVSARILKGSNVISVRLRIDVAMHLNCSRCLEEFVSPKSLEVKLDMPIEHKKIIDLTDNLREEIVLNFPLKPLCQPACLGLCATCGQNLNKAFCKCSEYRKQKTEDRRQKKI